MPVTITTKSNLLPKYIASIKPKIKAIVIGTADSIRGHAGDNAPRDTGSLSVSYYVLADGIDGYADAAAAAQALNKGMVTLDKVDPPPNDMTAYISSAAGHSPFVELGTVHMGAQPHLTPAAETAFNHFISEIAQALERLI